MLEKLSLTLTELRNMETNQKWEWYFYLIEKEKYKMENQEANLDKEEKDELIQWVNEDDYKE